MKPRLLSIGERSGHVFNQNLRITQLGKSGRIDAFGIHRNLELGKTAAEKLLELEPQKASHDALLSTKHGEAGRWIEVEKVRGLMEGSAAEKQPGYSWIEIRNQMLFSMMIQHTLEQQKFAVH